MLPHLESTLTDHIYSTAANERSVIKNAPEVRLRREMEVLRQFEGDAYIRQLIDHGKEPPFLVLEYLECDALRSSLKARFPRRDARLIARSILSALESLHGKGIAHTGDTFRLLCRRTRLLIVYAPRCQTRQHPPQPRQQWCEGRGSQVSRLR